MNGQQERLGCRSTVGSLQISGLNWTGVWAAVDHGKMHVNTNTQSQAKLSSYTGQISLTLLLPIEYCILLFVNFYVKIPWVCSNLQT